MKHFDSALKLKEFVTDKKICFMVDMSKFYTSSIYLVYEDGCILVDKDGYIESNVFDERDLVYFFDELKHRGKIMPLPLGDLPKMKLSLDPPKVEYCIRYIYCVGDWRYNLDRIQVMSDKSVVPIGLDNKPLNNYNYRWSYDLVQKSLSGANWTKCEDKPREWPTQIYKLVSGSKILFGFEEIINQISFEGKLFTPSYFLSFLNTNPKNTEIIRLRLQNCDPDYVIV